MVGNNLPLFYILFNFELFYVEILILLKQIEANKLNIRNIS